MELVGYHKMETTTRAKYTSKAAEHEQQAKEAWKREGELLRFEDMALENLIRFDKDVELQFNCVGKPVKRRNKMKNYVLHIGGEKKRTQMGPPSDAAAILAYSNEPAEEKPSTE